jgi:hypothetical protein
VARHAHQYGITVDRQIVERSLETIGELGEHLPGAPNDGEPDGF